MACQQRMQGGYADFFHAALAPVTNLPGDVVRRRCIAIISAAEALSDAMVRKRVSERTGADELCSLIVGWLAPAQRAFLAHTPPSQPRRQNGRRR